MPGCPRSAGTQASARLTAEAINQAGVGVRAIASPAITPMNRHSAPVTRRGAGC